MKFVISQVSPELCLTKEDFISVIDKKIYNIVKKHKGVDLIVFPEALGLWMCMMQPTTYFNKFFSRFLHTHYSTFVKISSIIQNDKYNFDEIVANIQFSRPKQYSKINRIDKKGLLDSIPDYYLRMKKRGLFSNLLIKISEWLFNNLQLSFIAQYMRSNEMFLAYKEAFSLAAKKYNIYIQAGSLFKRVINGTKNIAYVFSPDGFIICRQEKWHPIPFEGMLGIKDGVGYETFYVDNIKCGIAICNDLGFPNDLVAMLANNNCKFIASPSGGIVPSHLWKFDYKKDVEDCQQARANESNVVIGRSYNAGDLLFGILKFQGLSTIVEPGRLVAIVPEEKIKNEYNLEYEI